jgi:hypothetical protein
MKVASINELKQELGNMPADTLVEICVRLAKFKKENKELMNYLLFESHDEQGYIEMVKKEINEQFVVINQSNLYFAKKSIRKILRITGKYIKYTASKEMEIELLLHFCNTLKASGIPFHNSTALINLYQSQVKKISKTINTLHEDLQYDYLKMLKQLQAG